MSCVDGAILFGLWHIPPYFDYYRVRSADDNGENINDMINVNLQTLMVHGLMPLTEA